MQPKALHLAHAQQAAVTAREQNAVRGAMRRQVGTGAFLQRRSDRRRQRCATAIDSVGAHQT